MTEDWWENVREIEDINIEMGSLVYRWDVMIDGKRCMWLSSDRDKRDAALEQFAASITDDSIVTRVPLPDGVTSARYLTKEEGQHAVKERV